jgi:thiol:disulfide interchange protein DsbD
MKFLFQVCFSFFGFTAICQEHVNWQADIVDRNERYIPIQVSAEIEPGWHLYSAETPKDAGPIPIGFEIQKNRFVKLKMPFVEKTKAIKKFDANFDSDVYIFEDKFLGEFKVKSKKDTILSMTVTYMICNEVMCLPPIDETLSIKLDTNE